MRRALIKTTLVAMLAVLALGAGTPAQAAVPQAKLINDRRAVPPPSAPLAVKRMIWAGNRLTTHPYVWGGGHRRWASRGYDCSGAISYLMHAARLLDYPLVSGGFMTWGRGGPSRWVRIYANRQHVFAVIAGLRFDTSYITDGDRSGPGWSETMRPTRGFRMRHPVGLLRAR